MVQQKTKTQLSLSIDPDIAYEAKDKIPNISQLVNDYLKEYLDPNNSKLSKTQLENELRLTKARVKALELKHGELEEKEKIQLEAKQKEIMEEERTRREIEQEKRRLEIEEKARKKRVEALKKSLEKDGIKVKGG